MVLVFESRLVFFLEEGGGEDGWIGGLEVKWRRERIEDDWVASDLVDGFWFNDDDDWISKLFLFEFSFRRAS